MLGRVARRTARLTAAPAGCRSRPSLATLTRRPFARAACPAPSPPLEQLVELPLPLALFIGAHQDGDDFLLRQHLDDARRVRRHILARGQSSELGEELLAFLAEHEIGGETGGVRMRRLGIHADLAEE